MNEQHWGEPSSSVFEQNYQRSKTLLAEHDAIKLEMDQLQQQLDEIYAEEKQILLQFVSPSSMDRLQALQEPLSRLHDRHHHLLERELAIEQEVFELWQQNK